MRKKIFSALLVISTFGLMLSGCGSKEPSTPNEGENTQNNEGDNKGNEGENEQGGKEEGNEGNKDALDTNYPTTIPNLNEPAFQIHYKRKDNKYAEWGLWIWADGKDGAEYTFNYQDETGVIAYYPISTFGSTSIGFLTKKLFSVVGNNVWIKDTYADDRKLDLANLDPDENGCYHIFINDYEETIYVKNDYKTKMNVISTCEFSSYKKLVVSGNNKIKNVVISASGTEIINKSFETPVTRAEIDFEEDIDISTPYTAIVTFEDDSKLSSGISILKLYNSEFDEKYGYDGELGAIYSKDSTTFRVWSPISSKITLNIYDTGTPEDLGEGGTNTPTEVREMVKNEKGVFEITVNGDLHGKYYTYTVFNGYNLEGREIVDPYAKSAGVNGLRGMVVDFSRTNPEGWEDVNYLNYDRKATVVYETHVADVSSSKTWGGHAENAKKFTGLIETGTSYVSEDDDDNKVSTGFDSIKELGVNAVQLLPIFDQANDEINTSFNWGYNPLNYNVLEGSYSSDPYDGLARIREFKTVVRDYNEAGMSIIMDVVYNHVNGIDRSNFDTLMPYYYFRYVSSKTPYNGSGCGNETASEKAMFRKFMIDSTEFWMKEYKLGGFRFDLMGLHDTATMNLLVENLKEINPNALVYGEPWTGGASGLKASESAIQRYANKYKGFGAFNDLLRDSLIKGGLNPVSEKGWVTEASKKSSIGDLRDSLKGMTGTFTSDPNKMVAYATFNRK